MSVWVRRFALAGFFLPSLVFAQTAAVAGGATPAQSPVIAQTGAAFHVALQKQVRVKDAGVAVEGRVVEPIYVFDRIAIPAGTQVLGRVSSIEPLSRKRRALSIANGDFTPPRKAHVDFDTLVLKDGTRLPLHTSVSEGVLNVVHLNAGGTGKKKGRLRTAVEQAEQNAKDQVHQTVQQVTAPGKWQRLKAAIAAELPYRRQWLTAGTQFTAELTAPLEVAKTEPPPAVPDALAQLGHDIAPGSVVHVLLVTPLSSATEQVGSPVRAVVSEPLFSA